MMLTRKYKLFTKSIQNNSKKYAFELYLNCTFHMSIIVCIPYDKQVHLIIKCQNI